MKTNNKTRANKWEREASRKLSLWVSGGTKKNLFWRTNSSGAKGTRTKEKNHCGDIVAVDPAGVEFCDRFHVECKWKKSFAYADLGSLKTWIAKEGAKANQVRKQLLMVIKGRAGEIYILAPSAEWSQLKDWNIPVAGSEYLAYNGHFVGRIYKQ